jgi:predicted DNA-binding transcriptional regulator YafY
MKERVPLVVISNNHAYQYVNGKLNQSLKIDPMCVSSRQLRRDIEQFRVYGVEVDNE